jgi:hypothetical protein
MSTPPRFQVPIDEEKIPPEVTKHLRLIYDRLQNHYQAVQNLTAQNKSLQAQITALQGK